MPLWIDAQPGCQLESSLQRKVILPGYLGDLPPKTNGRLFSTGAFAGVGLGIPSEKPL